MRDIQNFISNKVGFQNRDEKILKTILTCKIKENKIIFKDDYFSKKLSLYFPAYNVEVKYITNDYLFLSMIFNRTVVPLLGDEKFTRLLEKSSLNSVMIESQNFELETSTSKGFIQDYDGNFSLICSENTDKQKIIEIIEKQPGKGTMKIRNEEYVYYGTEDICVITPEAYTKETVIEKCSKISFLQNNGSEFVSGEKSVTVDNKVKFLNKKVTPETFCPSFWACDWDPIPKSPIPIFFNLIIKLN